MTQKELTCICCPIGCNIQVELDGNQIIKVTGNNCIRGDAYARRELISPVRTVTTTVPVIGGERAVVSIKTEKEIPKDKIMDCIKTVKNVKVKAPVHIGDIVCDDVAGTGIAMVATANVEEKVS